MTKMPFLLVLELDLDAEPRPGDEVRLPPLIGGEPLRTPLAGETLLSMAPPFCTSRLVDLPERALDLRWSGAELEAAVVTEELALPWGLEGLGGLAEETELVLLMA